MATTTSIKNVYGTAQTVIDTAVDIPTLEFSVNTAIFTNTDTVVPDALYANAMLEVPDWGAAPLATALLTLWGLLQDVDGTDDDTDPPSGTSSGGAIFFGTWPIAAVDSLQRRTMVISLNGVRACKFYVQNGSAQNINNDGGTNMILKITPFSPSVTI